ncbi:MAG: (Fe-S)-binding protein [Leptospirales bacterium]|nr:(Fe-S)-binding protein [Leptospirales bacterium]
MIQAKELTENLDMFGCMQCGKCSAGCPESGKTDLNIRRIIRELTASSLCELKKTDPLWDCTSCSNCSLRCPRSLEPHELVIGLRGLLIEEGEIPPTARDALEGVFKHGNPWGRVRQKRVEWTEGLGIKNFSDAGENAALYYTCCAVYDPRIHNTARSIAIVLGAASDDFGILGVEESCCGSEMRRMGEAGLFEMIVEDNAKLFQDSGVKRIIAASPHCYDAIKNQYKIKDIAVRHYTQHMEELLNEGKIKLTKSLGKTVAYHDPCYLGKQNNVYDEPREILKAIPGINYIDFDRCREKSLCCGGGGGRMWLEGTGTGERLAQTRVKEAAEMDIDIIATACPFCLLTLEDAVKTTGFEEKILIKDISELIAEAL